MNKVYYNPDQINSYLLEIVRQMYKDNFHPKCIVGLSRGGLVPGVKLSHYLDIPFYALNKDESNLWLAEDALEGTEMLIVDDINDTGKTITELKKDWSDSHNDWTKIFNNGNVKFAVLINNEASTTEVNYIGFTINKLENPEWCVFPWEEWWNKI
jgi:hypoxanthine phosphoribosyltransferase